MCLYFDIFLQLESVESCVLGRHAKQSHSLTTIGYAHACPSISLIRCFAMPPTHFCVEPILMSYLLLSLNNLCVASVMPLFHICFLSHFVCLNVFGGVRIPCLCTLYSNAIIPISAQTLGSSPISFNHSFARFLMHML